MQMKIKPEFKRTDKTLEHYKSHFERWINIIVKKKVHYENLISFWEKYGELGELQKMKLPK